MKRKNTKRIAATIAIILIVAMILGGVAPYLRSLFY